MRNENDLLRFQSLIEIELKNILYKHHKPYMDQYFNYKNKIGRKCLLCRAAAKTMFFLEQNRKGQDFIQRFSSNDWEGYE